jgi:hypothetical protein
MKLAYLSFPDWEIESPITTQFGQQFRIDARHKKSGQCREFVHSLSDAYYEKCALLAEEGIPIKWIFDGGSFRSKRERDVASGGKRTLLRPLAADYYRDLRDLSKALSGTSQDVVVHRDEDFWRYWKNDLWFPIRTVASQKVIAAFHDVMRRRHESPRALPRPLGQTL